MYIAVLRVARYAGVIRTDKPAKPDKACTQLLCKIAHIYLHTTRENALFTTSPTFLPYSSSSSQPSFLLRHFPTFPPSFRLLFNMLFSTVTALLFAVAASAIQITTPGKNNDDFKTGETVNIQWTVSDIVSTRN